MGGGWLVVVLWLFTGACVAQTQGSAPPRPGEAAPIHTTRPVPPPPDATVSAPAAQGKSDSISSRRSEASRR